MMAELSEKPEIFIISYDAGSNREVQTVRVPHLNYNHDTLFQKNILVMKCLKCGLKSKFKKEPES